MKNALLALVFASLSSSAFASTLIPFGNDALGAKAEPAVKICGTIYRYDANGGLSTSNQIKITSGDDEVVVVGTNEEANATLDSILWPNDAFIGCVYGDEAPAQGFEGMIFGADEVVLMGQSSKPAETVKICGTIYRHDANGGLSSSNQVRIKEDDKVFVVVGANEDANATLDSIVAPNDAFIGCVYGDEASKQGFEGTLFAAKSVVLMGQSSGL